MTFNPKINKSTNATLPTPMPAPFKAALEVCSLSPFDDIFACFGLSFIVLGFSVVVILSFGKEYLTLNISDCRRTFQMFISRTAQTEIKTRATLSVALYA